LVAQSSHTVRVIPLSGWKVQRAEQQRPAITSASIDAPSSSGLRVNRSRSSRRQPPRPYRPAPAGGRTLRGAGGLDDWLRLPFRRRRYRPALRPGHRNPRTLPTALDPQRAPRRPPLAARRRGRCSGRSTARRRGPARPARGSRTCRRSGRRRPASASSEYADSGDATRRYCSKEQPTVLATA
jgi:hypothetical protein